MPRKVKSERKELAMEPKKFILFLMITAVPGICFIFFSASGQSVNLVKEEMLALDPAFKKIIDAVVLGDMRIVKPALHEVHEAREEVEKAVKAGKKITLQKNQNRVKEFIELDDKFHEEFEILERAAEAGNKKAVQAQTHKLLDACVVCHERIKK
jgi:cytochrome c556